MNLKNQPRDLVALLKCLGELDSAKHSLGDQPAHLNKLKREIETVRERLPTSLLIHYDLRRSRGKPAIVAVRGSVCGGCHLTLPSGRAAALRRGDASVQVCDHCGAFLYPGDSQTESKPDTGATKPGKGMAPRKQSAAANE
jgi:predicted  nucleic acid-binding Zn-ribbon protein